MNVRDRMQLRHRGRVIRGAYSGCWRGERSARMYTYISAPACSMDPAWDLKQVGRKVDELMQGTIKKIVSDRGFGFIGSDTGTELFFHASSVDGGAFDSLREGQRVEFATEQDPRGRGERAVQVRAAGD
jgi:cold shock protein